jgi:hypothetical protein
MVGVWENKQREWEGEDGLYGRVGGGILGG